MTTFKHIIKTFDYEIVFANETWLKDTTTDNMILTTHIIHRKDRLDSRGGGVLIAVKNTIKSIRQEKLESNFIEMICVELKLSNKRYLLVSVYIPPPKVTMSFNDCLSSLDSFLIQDSLNVYDNIIIQGDFNINCHQPISSQNATDLLSLFATNGFSQLIDKSTYRLSNSIIDL